MRGTRVGQRWAVVTLMISALACEPGSLGGESETSGEGDEVWLEFADGCSVEPYRRVEQSGQMTMVLGGQGSLMFPMHLRAGGFDLPPEFGIGDPETPRLDLQVRVDGYNNGPGDTFARIANYPVLFKADGEQTWDFRFLTIFVPDEISGGIGDEDPMVVDGLTATVTWEFEVQDHPVLRGSFTAELEVPSPFEPEPSCGF